MEGYRQEAASLVNRLMVATGGATVVYRWDEAPECLKAFSNNGGDEDFVIVHKNDYLWWAYKLDVSGDGEDTTHVVGDYHVTITAHA